MTEMRNRHIGTSCSQLIAVCAFIIMSGHAMAATYYVSGSTGNDAYPGLTANAPWKTIGKAASVMTGGDTVLVAAGNYPERVIVTRSGSSGRQIVYKAAGKAVTRGFTIKASFIEVNGFEITNTPDHYENGCGVFVQGSYNRVIGNYLHDVTRMGIFLSSSNADDPNVSNNLVQSNRIVRAGMVGIDVRGRNSTIEGNDISHTLQYPPTWLNKVEGMDADGIRFFGSGHIIRKNYIHDILKSDPGNVDPHIDCFQTWGPAHDIIFEQNHGINKASGMQGFMVSTQNGEVKNLIIRNNILETFRFGNIWGCPGVQFVNNLCIGSLSYTGQSGYGLELHECPGSTVMNNIFYDVGSHSYPYMVATDMTGLQVGYNLVYMSDGAAPKSSSYVPRSTDLWQIDPLLGNINDPVIVSNSPLVNRGQSNSYVTNDYYGNARPNGSGIDIGPFEYYLPTPRNLRAQ